MMRDLGRAAQVLCLPCGAAWGHAVVSAVAGCDDLPPPIRQAAPRRQQGFAAGRRAAADALQAAGWHGDKTVPIGPDQLPVWPAGWHGSISHTDDLATALVAPDCPVLGVDLERLMSRQLAFEVAPAIMPEARPGQAGIPPAQEVSRVFSAKEALYKALFPQTRSFRDFSAARAVWEAGQNPSDPPGLFLQLTECWGPEWPAGRRFQIRQALTPDHVLSLVWHKGGRGAGLKGR